MFGSRSVATTIRWHRIAPPPVVTTSKFFPSTSITSAISVASWTLTPRARSWSVTRASTSPEMGFPNRGSPGLIQVTWFPSLRIARAASMPR